MRSQNHWFYVFPGSKLKIQAFNDILDAAILSVAVCGEDAELTERFTCPGSDVHVSAVGESEVKTSWSGLGSYGFTGSWGVALPAAVWEGESLSLLVLGASSLALWM